MKVKDPRTKREGQEKPKIKNERKRKGKGKKIGPLAVGRAVSIYKNVVLFFLAYDGPVFRRSKRITQRSYRWMQKKNFLIGKYVVCRFWSNVVVFINLDHLTPNVEGIERTFFATLRNNTHTCQQISVKCISTVFLVWAKKSVFISGN